MEFEAFVQVHGRALLGLAYLLTQDGPLAEDLLQEVLLNMYRRWSRLGEVDSLLAYARRALVNQSVSWRRRRWTSERLVPAEAPPAPDHAPASVDRDLWLRTLRGLAPRPRAVLVLRYYEGLTDPEIADVLGCARATVRSIAARALADLRATHPSLLLGGTP